MEKAKVVMLCLVVASQLLYSKVNAQSNLDEPSVKALFIYNFTKYFDWQLNQSDNFVIGVYGQSFVAGKLKKLVESKSVNGNKLIVQSINSIDDAINCRILFIPKEESHQLSKISALLKQKGILVISDDKGMISKGSAINFIMVDNKVNFEVNKNAMKNFGLSPSNQLLAYASRIVSIENTGPATPHLKSASTFNVIKGWLAYKN